MFQEVLKYAGKALSLRELKKKPRAIILTSISIVNRMVWIVSIIKIASASYPSLSLRGLSTTSMIELVKIKLKTMFSKILFGLHFLQQPVEPLS